MLIPATNEFTRQDDDKAERRRRKEIERLDEERVLDPWEQYRALTDHCDHVVDLTELYDRKTRFALLILTGLNAINLLVIAKSDLVSASGRPGPMAIAYVLLYVLISLYLFACAISALRPRRVLGVPVAKPGDGSMPGVRLTRNILAQTLDEYCDNWRRVQIGGMNRELATMAYMVATINAAKHTALHRVYCGLYVLVALTAALVIGIGLAFIR